MQSSTKRRVLTRRRALTLLAGFLLFVMITAFGWRAGMGAFAYGIAVEWIAHARDNE